MKKIFAFILMMVITITAMAQDYKISFNRESLNVGSYSFVLYDSDCDIKYPSFNWETRALGRSLYDEDELKTVMAYIDKHKDEFKKDTGYSITFSRDIKILLYRGESVISSEQYEADLKNGIYHPTETIIRIHDTHEFEKKKEIREREERIKQKAKEDRLSSLL